jgi:hypothetical protein
MDETLVEISELPVYYERGFLVQQGVLVHYLSTGVSSGSSCPTTQCFRLFRSGFCKANEAIILLSQNTAKIHPDYTYNLLRNSGLWLQPQRRTSRRVS